MLTKEAKKTGGVARGVIERREALDRYYMNPNYCLECNLLIHVGSNQKVGEVKVKRFCTRSCSAKHHNAQRKKEKAKVVKITPANKYHAKTKGELFTECKNYFSARSTVTKNARRVMTKSGRTRVCQSCGYSKHVEVCHIKAFSEFNISSSLGEINSLDNMLYLCPNCHWEFDNGIIMQEALVSQPVS